MNKLIYTGILTLAALSLGSCSEENRGLLGDAKGKIAMNLNVDSEVKTGKIGNDIVISRAAASKIEKEDLTLRVTSSDGSYSESWKYDEFPQDQTFSIGDYTVEAFYGKENEEGFEKPFYHDETSIKVMENEVTPVSLTATVNNSMIEVQYTDDFKKFFSGYSATVTGSTTPVYVSPKETRPVYVKPGTTSVTVTMTNPQGVETKLKSSPFVAKKRTHHPIKFGTATVVGKPVVTITYDDSLEMEEEVINLDDLVTAPEPTLNTDGFTSGEAVSIVETSLPDNPLKVHLEGRAGITSVILTTNSSALRQHGWPAKVELVNADAETQATLNSLGLDVRGLFKSPDRMAVIDFSKVCENISYMDGGLNQSTFTVTLTDRFERQAEPVTLSVKTVKALFEFGEFEPLFYSDPDVSLTFHYNGSNLAKDVKFLFQNDRGTFTEVSDLAVTHLTGNSYNVTFTVPGHEHDLTLRADWGSRSVELVIPRCGLSVDQRNVFAKTAEVSMTFATPKKDDETLTFYAESGLSFKQLTYETTANGYKLLNLTPNTTYKVFATVGELRYNTITFKTENALQLPVIGSAGYEWSKHDSGNRWVEWMIGDGTVWGTNNPMTTSQGDNYPKNKYEGTLPSDENNPGTGVILRTVGWGSSNQALGNSGSTKYADAGLLHLGKSRGIRPDGYGGVTGPLTTDDLDPGYLFTSRPSAISFKCRYSPKNNADKGLAYIAVLDENGNVIRENQILIDNTAEDTQTIPLEYGYNSPTASKIYVKFLSTYTSEALQSSTSWLNFPGFAGLTQAYHGSELFIDEIKLEY